MKLKEKICGIILSLCMSSVLMLVIPVSGAGENLLQNVNPGFETVSGGLPSSWWTSESVPPELVNQGAPEGQNYLKLPKTEGSSASASIMAVSALTSETNYNFSFDVYTTEKDSAQLDIRFLIGSELFDDWHLNPQKNTEGLRFVGGQQQILDKFGTGKGEWQHVTMNFTTPKRADGISIKLNNISSGADVYVGFDNFCITPSGDAPNLVKNGKLTAFESANDASSWAEGAASNKDISTISYGEDSGKPAGDKHYFQSVGGERYIAQNLALSSGCYVLSFYYYRGESMGTNRPSVRFDCPAMENDGVSFVKTGVPLPDTMIPEFDTTSGRWRYYELYFNVPENPNTAFSRGGYNLYMYLGIDNWNTYRFSDIKVLPVGNGQVSYYSKETTPKFLSEFDAVGTTSQRTYKSIEGISAAGETINVAGHYAPKTTEAESFTMINAHYKRFKDTGIRVLVEVKVTQGSTTGGKGKLIYNELTIGAKQADYTDEILSFIVSSLDDMKPMGIVNTITN